MWRLNGGYLGIRDNMEAESLGKSSDANRYKKQYLEGSALENKMRYKAQYAVLLFIPLY